jgi:hypothetical protein
MTAPTISATPKKALDQRATSRHDNARVALAREGRKAARTKQAIQAQNVREPG